MLFLIKLIVLSLVQGVGEILPISSSGHLIVLSKLFNIDDSNISIEIMLHLASLVALLVYYFDFIKGIIQGVFSYVFKSDKTKYREWSYFISIVIASIPTCIIGLILNNYLSFLTSYIGILLVINGLLLLIKREYNDTKNIEDLTMLDKFKIGLIQSIGVIPGISRSGSSLLGCNQVKLNKEDSFNLTFLLLFPLVIGSLVLNISDFNFDKTLLIPYIISFLLTTIVTYFSLALLHSLVARGKSKIFGWYCVSVGTIYSIILLVI